MDVNVTNSDFIWPYVEPPIYEPLWFEKFDVAYARDWMEQNWQLSVYICVIYTVIVVCIQRFMRDRKPFCLKEILALWNLSIAIFSVVGLVRCLPELLYVLKGPDGFHRSVCTRDSHTQASAWWACAFTWSKVAELGDTMFIVLRKKPLPFIHYYHHSVALIVCWCYYSDYEPIARYFGIINFAVHSVLYFYLFLKAINVHVHPFVAKCILSFEVLQMIVGLVVNSYALSVKAQGVPCARNPRAIGLQMLLYLSFLLIFLYLFNAKRSQTSKRKKAQ